MGWRAAYAGGEGLDTASRVPYQQGVQERTYNATSDLSRPGKFVARAWRDAHGSVRGAWLWLLSDLRANRRRSLFGYFAMLIPVAGAVAICVYLQSRQIVRIDRTALPYGLHVLAGMALWQTLVDGLGMPYAQLNAVRRMISRSTVPHEVFLLAGLFEIGLNATVRMAVLLLALLAFGVVPAAGAIVLLPAGCLALALMGMGIGLVLAPLEILFHDLQRVRTLCVTFWFFLSPIFYAAPAVGFVRFNPATPLIETARQSILQPHASAAFAGVAAAALMVAVAGWLFYRLASPYLIERLG